MGGPDSLFNSYPSIEPVASIQYWKLTSEHLGSSALLSGKLSELDVLQMADTLSRSNNCVVLVQKIVREGYGEEQVTWQRYLINGLDSFRPDSPGKTNKQKKTKVSKDGEDVRRPVRREEACPQPNLRIVTGKQVH